MSSARSTTPSLRARARHRFADHHARHLLSGSAWLVVAVGLNGLGGLAFWATANVINPTELVGGAQQLFTGVLVVTYFTSMGLPIAIARYCRDDSHTANVLFSWSLLYTLASSAVGTLVFIIVAPTDMAAPLWEFGFLPGTFLFFSMVAGMSFAILVEVRLMTLRMWSWVVARVFLVVAIRLPLLWVDPVGNETLWMFMLIAGAPALSGLVGALALRRAAPQRTRLRPLPSVTGQWLRYSSVNYLGLLASQGPTFLLPLIVALNVDADEYFGFYIAWGVTAVVFLIPHMLGQTLLAEAGKDGARLNHQIRIALVLAVGLLSLIAVAVYFGAPLVAPYLDADYKEAARLLPVLVAAGVPWSITTISLARARALERTSSIVLITVTFFIATLGLTLLLTPGSGVDGAAQAWILGNLIAAGVAATTLFERSGPTNPMSYVVDDGSSTRHPPAREVRPHAPDARGENSADRAPQERGDHTPARADD